MHIAEGIFDPINIAVDVEVDVETDVEVELTNNIKLKTSLNESVNESIHFLSIVEEMSSEVIKESISFSFDDDIKA